MSGWADSPYGVARHGSNIRLGGSAVADLPKKQCQGACGEMRTEDGGCQMRPDKWVCAKCWRGFNSRKKKP